MVGNTIFEIAEQLKRVMHDQQAQARKALISLPEGETKDNLRRLLNEASTGKLSLEDAQREIQNIMKNAC